MLVSSENLACREVRDIWQQEELSQAPGWLGQGLLDHREEAAWPVRLPLKILP